MTRGINAVDFERRIPQLYVHVAIWERLFSIGWIQNDRQLAGFINVLSSIGSLVRDITLSVQCRCFPRGFDGLGFAVCNVERIRSINAASLAKFLFLESFSSIGLLDSSNGMYDTKQKE